MSRLNHIISQITNSLCVSVTVCNAVTSSSLKQAEVPRRGSEGERGRGERRVGRRRAGKKGLGRGGERAEGGEGEGRGGEG